MYLAGIYQIFNQILFCIANCQDTNRDRPKHLDREDQALIVADFPLINF